jgi:hypothetical protein
VTLLNTQAGNVRQGLSYSIIKAPGGVYHVYPNGQKIFVAAHTTPAAPAAPAAPSVDPSGDPRDSQYLAESAQDTFSRNQQLSSLAAQDASAATNYAEALRRYKEQLPNQQRAELVNANKAGLAQSTYLSERQANNAIQAQRHESDMASQYEAERAAREAARQALLQGATVEEASRLAEAAGRQFDRDTSAADANALVANPTTAASVKTVAKDPGYKTVVKNGKVYRYYPGRKPVYIRPATRR